jgi:carbonic anhydrase
MFAASCGDDDATTGDTAAEDVAGEDTTDEPPAFAYEGDTGPENWGSLSAGYAKCSDGTEQSPIDLTGASVSDIADIQFTYGEVPLAIFNNGHTIEVELTGATAIDVEGTTYTASQFHFHAGSEHLVDGEQFPLEMHIVHRDADDNLAVVGLLVDVGAENEALASLFENIPTEVSEEGEEIAGATVDLGAVLPAAKTYYKYAGSLTTPPCSEGVSWMVLETPIEISQAQLDTFTEVIEGNFRPMQPLGDRELVVDEASGR